MTVTVSVIARHVYGRYIYMKNVKKKKLWGVLADSQLLSVKSGEEEIMQWDTLKE